MFIIWYYFKLYLSLKKMSFLKNALLSVRYCGVEVVRNEDLLSCFGGVQSLAEFRGYFKFLGSYRCRRESIDGLTPTGSRKRIRVQRRNVGEGRETSASVSVCPAESIPRQELRQLLADLANTVYLRYWK